MKMLACAIAFCLLACAAVAGDVPTLMNYQGRLTKADGTPVQDGNYRVRFSIWADATGGTEKWFQEMNPVVVRNGVFAVLLGGPQNPLTATVFSGPSWLEIQVGNDPPLAPRQQIVTVAYAFQAQNAATADRATTAETADKVKDGAITTAMLADGAVTAPKLATDPLSLVKVSGGALTASGGLVTMPNHTVARAYKTTNQTVPGPGIQVKVQFQNVTVDRLGEIALNSDRCFTAKFSGWYLVSISVMYYCEPEGVYTTSDLNLWVNGIPVAGTSSRSDLTWLTHSLTDVVYLNAGDYIEVTTGQHHTGSGVRLEASNLWTRTRNYFSIVRLY